MINLVKNAYAYEIPSPTPQFSSLGSVLSKLLPAVLTLAGLLTFGLLILGGFKYLTAGGDEKAVTAAKNTLTNAIIGLIIVFMAYWIITILESVLGLNIVSGLSRG